MVGRSCVFGLTWQGCVAGLTASDCSGGTAGHYDWAMALGYCDGLDWGGHQDWRLPNAKELLSILNQRRASSPVVDVTAFPNTPANYFWSSSSYVGNPSGAWYADTSYGYSLDTGKTDTIESVRCVRGGP